MVMKFSGIINHLPERILFFYSARPFFFSVFQDFMPNFFLAGRTGQVREGVQAKTDQAGLHARWRWSGDGPTVWKWLFANYYFSFWSSQSQVFDFYFILFSSKFFSFKNMCKLKPILERWLEDAERYLTPNQQSLSTEAQLESARRRKKRTSIDNSVKGELLKSEKRLLNVFVKIRELGNEPA